ncbi:MAG: SrtC [Microgenomates group bacterium GW2011_GWA1_46_15]|nr:MAG: SrtC [Microgenomates group bacterium GW2011_GWA1_46_15]
MPNLRCFPTFPRLKEYEEALKHGVAHAKGTGLPGDDGGINKTIVIFSHSTNGSWNITKYNALFYSLKDLKEEDQIQVWFWGKEYWYKVKEKKVIEPNDVSFLKPQMDTEKLILQTCWPPGTISKRLLIVAERVQN